MKPLSLKIRATLLTVVIIAIVIIVISSVAYHELEESLVRVPDKELLAVIATVRSTIDDWASQPTEKKLMDILEQSHSTNGTDLLVWSEGKEITFISAQQVYTPALIEEFNRAKRPDAGSERVLTLRYENNLYRVAWFRHRYNNDTLSVLAITSISYAQHEMEEFLQMLLILGISMLLATAILVSVSVLWSLRPIRAVAVQLDGVTHRNLGAKHLDDISTPVELRPFVDSVRAMLVRVNEGVQSQKRFVAEASHELRTPLALAKSTIQAARLKARTIEQYQQALDELLGDIDRLGRLVGQLLDLARLDEVGRNAFEQVDLHTILRSLADQYSTKAVTAGCSITCDFSDGPLIVKGCPNELESLFSNLIDNAIKHGPSNGIITLRAVANDDKCLVSVHDEGGCIPLEEINRLFDRFYRIDESRSRATGGSGLGLAISRQIVSRHRGDIQIASAPTEGTTVSVHLPLANLN